MFGWIRDKRPEFGEIEELEEAIQLAEEYLKEIDEHLSKYRRVEKTLITAYREAFESGLHIVSRSIQDTRDLIDLETQDRKNEKAARLRELEAWKDALNAKRKRTS